MMNSLVADYLPVLVPSALLLWVLRDVGVLKTMLAKEVEKTTNLRHDLNKALVRQHGFANRAQIAEAKVSLLEWRLDSQSGKL